MSHLAKQLLDAPQAHSGYTMKTDRNGVAQGMSKDLRTVMLEARNLTLAWDITAAPVVANLTLCVAKGELVCLVGKSGTGKTTILHALAGLLTPAKGTISLQGKDITGVPGHISYMLQKDLLLPNLTVRDNVCLPLTLAGVPKHLAHKQAIALLQRLGIVEAADKWPSELSGGMRQRAAFARTYLMGNDMILLDEPFSALDAITRSDIRVWYKTVSAELGLSSLMITHDADEAALLADKVYVLGNDHPATITGILTPVRSSDKTDYSLTQDFLECKKEIVRLIKA